MQESQLEQIGKRYFLTCYYNPKLKDWDRAISQAMQKHRLKEGQATIICKPSKKGADNEGR